MISLRKPIRRECSPSFVWPADGKATTQNPSALFGPRDFPAHVATEGFSNDFHPGCDLPFTAGDPVHSVSAGQINRLHHTHYGFENVEQLNQWTEIDPNSAAVFTQSGTSLHIVGSRVGSETFAQSAIYAMTTERFNISTSDWEIRWIMTSTPTVTGAVFGVGLYDSTLTEYVAMEYDGTTLTAVGIQAAGAISGIGTPVTASPPTMRIRYTQSTDTIDWQYTTDNPVTTSTVWTTVATKASVAFTREGITVWTPVVYYRSTSTNAATNTIDIDFVGWYDDPTIGRNGNWVENINAGKRCQFHFQDLLCKIGDLVEAGQIIGYAGSTGFDNTSGPLTATHCHVEHTPLENYFYNRADGINPLGAGLLPRTDVSNNVACVRSSANDPDGVSSHLLTITVTRADQDFDMNEISLTGNTTVRTINFNTRSGLNASVDTPKQSGVYYVQTPGYSAASATYVLLVYFNKSVVGSTFSSGYIKDCNGNTLVTVT